MRKRQEGSPSEDFMAKRAQLIRAREYILVLALVFFFSFSISLFLLVCKYLRGKEGERARNTRSTLQILKPRRVNPVTLRFASCDVQPYPFFIAIRHLFVTRRNGAPVTCNFTRIYACSRLSDGLAILWKYEHD